MKEKPPIFPEWYPSATLQTLQKRAQLIRRIRQFFVDRGVLEVDTPLLSHATVTDPHVHSLPACFQPPGSPAEKTVYLQTSPEYAMKRLLAAGSGSIYQICKAFRQDEPGSQHNPEFTMLEWYRPGFDHHALMDEMDELLQAVAGTLPARRYSYMEVFMQQTGLDPYAASEAELLAFIQKNIALASDVSDRNDLLDLIMSRCVEPEIANDRPAFVYDFPASQAALARIRYSDNPPVASRFEVYFRGMELANGFHELQDASEQRKRFEHELALRQRKGLVSVPLDERFLAALTAGLPDCAGVALGIDRLILLALQDKRLADVISFDFARA